MGQLTVLAVTGVVGFTLFARHTRDNLDRQFGRRALVVAKLAAADPRIRAEMASGDVEGTVATLADEIRLASGATYVVVMDRDGIRHSHPNPALIGQRNEEPVIALDGQDHFGAHRGSLGRSANGKAPLRAPDGTVIGQVSAGILENQVSSELAHQVPGLVLYSAIALAVGVAFSLLLAGRLKRRTLGLELDEIAGLLQEREAMLHAIHDGVVTLDPAGRISLVNDKARQLLGLGSGSVGSTVDSALPPGRLRDLVTGADMLTDATVMTNDRCLTVARMPVSRGGNLLGAVVTLHDQTAMVDLLRELDSVRALTDALRAQQHEHSNRMHTVAGLLELGRVGEAADYLQEIAGSSAAIAETLQERIGNPRVVALLLGKIVVAAEHGVRLQIEADGSLDSVSADDLTLEPAALVTVIGNLVDNAIDAAQGTAEATVWVRFASSLTGDMAIDVSDTGPGVGGDSERLFLDGFSTKGPRADGLQRGLGLALIRRVIIRAGGDIAVEDTCGVTTFRVRLPIAVPVS
jgi:two-component system, CitB family, sensor kinase